MTDMIFIIYTVTLMLTDTTHATVYYPQVATHPRLYVVSANCSRLDWFSLDCWHFYTPGQLELKIDAPCALDVVRIGISQRSRQGQRWQDVEIPVPCYVPPPPPRSKPGPPQVGPPVPGTRIWFPWVPIGYPAGYSSNSQ